MVSGSAMVSTEIVLLTLLPISMDIVLLFQEIVRAQIMPQGFGAGRGELISVT